jgi:Protein of unknown function (DUF2716)
MSTSEPASPGWEPMPDDIESEFVVRFKRRFSFRPDFYREGWPSIREPARSVTLDLSSTWTGSGPDIEEGNELILGLLVAGFPAGERLVAINYNHFAWWFWPHRFSAVSRAWYEEPANAAPGRDPEVFVAVDPWAVHPFPNGDYSIIVSEDMSAGTFGHPWEQTLCVFGERLAAAASSLTSYWPVKRSRR